MGFVGWTAVAQTASALQLLHTVEQPSNLDSMLLKFVVLMGERRSIISGAEGSKDFNILAEGGEGREMDKEANIWKLSNLLNPQS